jgi:16S rRNA G1207 methylase RsmC
MAEHYFSEKQKSENKRFEVQVRLKNDSFKIMSAPGIFSKDELDTATKLLIENAVIGKKILDLGCGYGVIGLSVLRKNKGVEVYFSDVNERALELTNENLKALNLNGKVVKSNVFDNLNEGFDTILSNPPMAAGRKVCFQIIEESFKHLEKDGILQIVARHNKGGRTLSDKMEEVFGNVEATAKSGGFRVYLSRR